MKKNLNGITRNKNQPTFTKGKKLVQKKISNYIKLNGITKKKNQDEIKN